MKKKILVAFIYSSICIVCFFIGGFLGFNQGYTYFFANSANEASTNVSVLNLLKDKQYEKAQSLLNITIDIHILTYREAKFSDDFIIPFSPILFVLKKDQFDKNMQKVLKYRHENPSNNESVTAYVNKNIKK